MASLPAPGDEDLAPLVEGRIALPDGPCYQLRLLDGFSLEQDGRPVHTPHSVRRLIAFLGVRGRRGRAEIAGTLWPDVTETRAQASLRTVLWRMHRLTPRPLVAGGESLALAGTVGVDVRELVATARHVLTEGEDVPLNGSPLPALTVMGDLLPGWYEDWVLFERERLRQLQMHALEAMASRLTAERRYAEAIEAAMAAVRLEPLRESAIRALIAAHLAENNVSEALRWFDSFRNNLNSELGVDPTSDLVALMRSGIEGQA